jgi:hypothetical protein
MSKINVRSPYIIYDNSTFNSAKLESATLYLWIYTGNSSATIPTTSTYSLFSTAIDGEVTFEISELVRDYVENNFDGNYDSNIVWVNWGISRLYVGSTTPLPFDQQTLAAFDGYGYFEEGTNPQNDSIVLQSNDFIYTNDLSSITIPVHVSENVDVTYLKDNEPIFTKTLTSSTNSADQIQYVSNSSLGYEAFYNRVITDGGTIESLGCVKEIADDYHDDLDADEIYVAKLGGVEVIKIEEIKECKYDPYKITFVNKYGALQDIWFFKKSNLSMKTKQENYKANIVSAGSYSVNERQNYIFNKTGTETLKLNTGFYPESYNEVFRQLSLSEEVWIVYENQTLPINIVSSNLNYKTSRNDKLINYTIDVEFSNDKINNIR